MDDDETKAYMKAAIENINMIEAKDVELVCNVAIDLMSILHDDLQDIATAIRDNPRV